MFAERSDDFRRTSTKKASLRSSRTLERLDKLLDWREVVSSGSRDDPISSGGTPGRRRSLDEDPVSFDEKATAIHGRESGTKGTDPPGGPPSPPQLNSDDDWMLQRFRPLPSAPPGGPWADEEPELSVAELELDPSPSLDPNPLELEVHLQSPSAPPAELLGLGYWKEQSPGAKRPNSLSRLSFPSALREEFGEPPLMRGTVYKIAEGGKMQQRFWELRGRFLVNYTAEDASGEPVWKVDLNHCSVTEGPGNEDILVYLANQPLQFACPSRAERDLWMRVIEHSRSKEVNDYYDVERKIGAGTFAEVFLGRDRRTGNPVAIKKIEKEKCSPKQLEFILREVNITKKIRHANIVSTYDVLDFGSRLYLIMEYMPGGEFFDVITSSQRGLTEAEARRYMTDIVRGVAFLHIHGIVHRDLKPENLLCTAKQMPLTVKIADFGLAGFVNERSDPPMIGTLCYMAPEVIRNEPYGFEVDMWSLGVILYVMLSGTMPFYGDNQTGVIGSILAGSYYFPPEIWAHRSESAISLVRSLLQTNPRSRLTAKAVLNHRWMVEPQATGGDGGRNRPTELTPLRRFRRAGFCALAAAKISKIIYEDWPGPP